MIKKIILLASTVLFSLAAQAQQFPENVIIQDIAIAKQGKEVPLERLAPGELITVEFSRLPIYIYKRTPADILTLKTSQRDSLADPDSENFRASVKRQFSSSATVIWANLLLQAEIIAARKPSRSIDESILVVSAAAPTSGCMLAITNTQEKRKGALFKDPCTGHMFDSAGRAFRGSGIFNLAVPPYSITSSTLVLKALGTDTLDKPPFPKEDMYQTQNATQLLISAALYNDMESVKAAIKQGADINHFRVGEASPIDAAIAGSSIHVVKFMLKNGAMSTPNSETLAQALERQDVLKLLNP
jgi:Rieske Fe-S protein